MELTVFERYTEAARRTLFFARYEATQHGAVAIEPEHLLLGLVRESSLAALLGRFGIEPEILRSEIETLAASAPKPPGQTEIPFSAQTESVLKLAAGEADRLRHPHITSGHLLLGVIADDSSRAAAALKSKGVILDAARQQVSDVGEASEPSPRRMRRPQERPFNVDRHGKPDVPPSYEIRISASTQPPGTTATSGGSWWCRYGFTLAGVLSDLFKIDEGRIELPESHDRAARFDIVAVLPEGESRETLERLVTQAIERHFDVTITFETRFLDVYALSAHSPSPTGGPLSGRAIGGGFFSMDFPSQEEMDAAHARVAQISDVMRAAAGILAGARVDTPYVRRMDDLPDEVAAQLRSKLGIVITPERRESLVLVAAPRR